MIRLAWLRRAGAKVRRPDQSCFSCASFHYCDPEDVDGRDGYCCDVSAPYSDVAHGGHWESRDSWCRLWNKAAQLELDERIAVRQRIFGNAGAAALVPHVFLLTTLFDPMVPITRPCGTCGKYLSDDIHLKSPDAGQP